MELSPIQIPGHVGIGEENLRCAALDDYVKNVRAAQLVERLSRENHCCIVFPPSFERFDDISLNVRVSEEYPCLINQERFKNGGDFSIRNDRVGAVRLEEHTSELQSHSF